MKFIKYLLVLLFLVSGPPFMDLGSLRAEASAQQKKKRKERKRRKVAAKKNHLVVVRKRRDGRRKRVLIQALSLKRPVKVKMNLRQASRRSRKIVSIRLHMQTNYSI